ncbi:MAG: FIST C-terminal domain-containing protein, partial [Bacteroidia bacterium]|nr:FIST C-terminal domain-containing protein [Bacteroidia bacterium]
WDPFGPEREITKAEGNRLYELDGKPALQLYKEYLGEKAKELPGAALLFPLAIWEPNQPDAIIVRTIAGLDEETQSLSFFGDIPQGANARLMKANFSNLVQGASGAASTSKLVLGEDQAELAILISCVGRKLILGQKIDEEVDSVKEALGEQTKICGFYSYGELAPDGRGANCALHNQTMTITLLSEKA